MIEKINNFTNRSFSNYTGPIDNFKSKNILFGYNGCGKSSLVEGLKNEFLNDKSNSLDNIRIYSADFINKSLLLEPTNRRNIKGVKAIFGEKNINTEEEIKALKAQLKEQSDIQNRVHENEKLETGIRKEISKLFNSKKGSLRIQAKPSSLTIKETIKAYEDDLAKTLKIESRLEEIEKITGDDTIEKRVMTLSNLELLGKIRLSPVDFSKLEEIQTQNYDDIQIPNSTIIKWLEEGLSIHDGKSNCEFCGSPINFLSIKEKVDAYSKNVKFEAENYLRSICASLQSDLSGFKQLNTMEKNYVLLIDKLENHFTSLKSLLIEIENTVEILNNNAKNITKITILDLNDFESKIENFNSTILYINDTITQTIRNEQEKLNKLNTLVKGSISIAISKSTLIKNNIDKINDNNNLVDSWNQKNQELNNRIKELAESKEVVIDFMKLVNLTLQDLNISIKLAIEEKDYILHSTLLSQNELSIDDISEGEKNMLSLLFFYFEMFTNKDQTNLKSDIKLIILDDPISSMDDSNRFYVLEIVKSILKLQVEQVFIMTHVWDDYCQLTFGINSKDENSPYASFEIRKLKQSTIIKSVSKGTPYKHMFKEVYNLSLKSELSNDCEYFHLPNTIRRVFEEFLFFKTNGTIPTNSSKNKIESLFKITSITAKTKLGTLLTVINVLSHNNAKSSEDILMAAKFLMKIIHDNDKMHYDAMKE